MTAMPSSVTLTDTVSVSSEVLVQEVGGEAVLLDLASEQYFGLDAVGTRIWELLAETPRLQDVATHLCTEFDATSATIEQDLLALVSQLADAGLVKVQ